MGVDVFGLRNKMIITKLKGGLGNQMFQYATGFAVALQNKVSHKIDISGYDSISIDTPRKFELGAFQITSPIALSEEITIAKYPFGLFSKAFRYFESKILKKHYLDFEPKLFKKIEGKVKNKKSIYLDGFFQSEKNFINFEKEIKTELTFKRELLDEHVKNLAEIIKSQISISIHVRHGDYINDKKTNKYHGVCSIDYYEKAIKLISQKIDNTTFYIFSDDSNWCEENIIKGQKNFINISKENFKDYEEMYLMSLCKHNIIANSTFSWWSAWLNKNSDKIVFAPKIWTVKENLHKNIIPETWIKI